MDALADAELSQLVRERREELGLSLRRLAERCVDPEGDDDPLWKHALLHRLERCLDVIPPNVAQLRALAIGLDTHLSVVQGAAGRQFMGIGAPWDGSRECRELVESYLALSVGDRERVFSIARLWGGGGSGG
ncbi:hypothetical protein [Streptomyces niveus]|uniref:hypothetical protein n=1 Tax=Streptomyces niveus TaxID=193462 RepID=UPI003870594D